ncbi:MAG: hypothetical protein Ta2F_04280 [Termitinemataceae bacterium]|nr:MAG: hypothetical protein Ta2F_04280 [Termitinemataceae bacterium]
MKIKLTIICIFICNLFVLFSCANLGKDKQVEAIKKVKAEVVKTKEVSNTVNGFGTLSYQKKVDVITNQDGAIEKFIFREGDRVTKNAVVIVLNNPQIVLAVERAENALAQADAAVNMAKSQLFDTQLQAEAALLNLEKSDAEMKEAWKSYYEEERKQKSQEILFEAGGVSNEAIRQARFELESKFAALQFAEKDQEIKRIGFRDKDLIAAGMEVPEDKEERKEALIQLLIKKACTEIEAAEASRGAAEKELKSANLAKDELIIRSPINGIIAAKYLEESEHVKREDKLLTIMESDHLYAVIPVRESDSFKIQHGMEAFVEIDGINSSYNGKVDLISPYADSKSYTFSVRVLFDVRDILQNSKMDFPKPGMFSRVSINLGKPRAVLVISESALFNIKNDSGSVFVVNGKTVTERKVLLGEMFEGEREILNGLTVGEVAVLQPDSDLEDGSYVSVAQ